jgi:hypothetical protein
MIVGHLVLRSLSPYDNFKTGEKVFCEVKTNQTEPNNHGFDIWTTRKERKSLIGHECGIVLMAIESSQCSDIVFSLTNVE